VPAAEAAQPISLAASKPLFESLNFHRHVALAVSGGSDSTALMWLAQRWAKAQVHPPKISVLTVDHGLRAEAEAECRQVASWAEALGLAAHILTWTGEKPASGLQAKARAMRYGLMRDWCQAHGATLLVTAHTLEDQAETFLMRLARGSGIRGLSAMRPDETGALLLERPLLGTSRAALRATLEVVGHPWIADPSNEDDRFERVRLRKAFGGLSALGLTPEAIARSAARLERALVPLEGLTRDFMAQHVEVRPEGFAMVDLLALRKLGDEVAIGVLERLLERMGGGEPPRLMAVEALQRWLRQSEAKPRTLAGCRIAQRKRHLLVGREAGRISQEPVAISAGESVLWDNRFRVSIGRAERPCAIVPVRGLRLVRHPHIPAFVQDGLPAILSQGEIAAVPSLGIVGKSAPPGLQAAAEFRKVGL
jgi:tRNA(Ile)-lysidine synthase